MLSQHFSILVDYYSGFFPGSLYYKQSDMLIIMIRLYNAQTFIQIIKIYREIIVSTTAQMQMDNLKALITPVSLYYTSSKPYSILVKLKRILISTGYQLQKFECKKQSQLKNNVADFSASSITSTFSFKLSKQFELSNTKVDLMVFGFLGKDVKLLGVATLDLGLFQHTQFKSFPIIKDFKLKLQKCEDANAYLAARLQLDKNNAVQQNVKQLQYESEKGGNSLIIQSSQRESIIMCRRKQYDMPSAYEISRKNYKQTEITRNNEDRSKSKNRNDSGSYRKRFQYQYHRNNNSRQIQQDQIQVPPNRVQTKPQSRGSPVPRIKTPQPITEFQINSKSKQKKLGSQKISGESNSYSRQKNIQSKWGDGYSKNNKNANSRIKVVVDVYQEQRVIEYEGADFEKSKVVKRYEEQSYQKIKTDSDQDINIKQTGRFVNNEKNSTINHQPGKISQQHVSSQNKGSPQKNENSTKQHQHYDQQNYEQRNRKKKSQVGQTKHENSQNYHIYRQKMSKGQQHSEIQQHLNSTNKIESKENIGIIRNNQIKKNVSKRYIQPEFSAKQPKSERQQSANKFKSITDKLQIIEHKIKEARKSESPPGPSKQQISSQNTYGYNEQDEDQFEPRKPFSPYSTKQKHSNKENSKGRQIPTEKTDKLSANTFKQNTQKSIQENSPHSNFIKSFDHLSQSQARLRQQDSNALGSIMQQTGNAHSQSVINISNKSPWYRKDSRDKKDWKKDQSQRQTVDAGKQIQNRKQQNSSVNSLPGSQKTNSAFQSSVANFSVHERDDVGQVSNIEKRQKQMQESRNEKQKQIATNYDKKQISSKVQKKKPGQNQIQKIQKQEREKYKPQQREEVRKQKQQKQKQQESGIEVKKKQIKKLSLMNELSIEIEPTKPKYQTKAPEQPTSQNKQNNIDLHKKCEQRINELQNLLDLQQQAYRKQLMQKQLNYKKSIKEEQIKTSKMRQQELNKLKQENNRLKQKEKEFQKKQQQQQSHINIQSKQFKDSKQGLLNSQEIGKLKDQNFKLRNLVDKLNNQLEQVDEKHFEALTAAEKKDLEYQRKMDVLVKKNNQLTNLMQTISKQNKQQAEKIKKLSSLPSIPSQTVTQSLASQSDRNIKAEAGSSEQKSYHQQFLAQKKKNVNLEAQIRQKNNEIKFLKIKNDNLLQEKKDLENQIDNIAINNKLEMAKQGSISKMNLEAASTTNSVKVENKVLKEQINSLQRQVHELNGLLEGIIVEGNKDEERISSSRQISERQKMQSMQRRYRALQKKTEAYQQELKAKQMKIAEIINVIFSYGNPKLMDQVSNLIGMSS